MSDKKTEKLFHKAISAVKARKGRGLVFGATYQPYRKELLNLIRSLKWDGSRYPRAAVGAAKAKKIWIAAHLSGPLPRPGHEVLIDEYKNPKDPWTSVNVALYLANEAGRYRVRIIGQLEDYFETPQESPLLQTRKAKLGLPVP